MTKSDVLQNERARWNDLFEACDDSTKKSAEGLIQTASFLRSMCWELEQIIDRVGVIKVHPEHPEMQKTVPAVKEYARLADSFANVTNKLNTLRLRVPDDDKDDLKEFDK